VKRHQSRRGNGRFQRNTLENTFGLRALVCVTCRSFNTHGLGEARPTTCHACAKPLVDIADATEAQPGTKKGGTE
jgi:hypothetical protein